MTFDIPEAWNFYKNNPQAELIRNEFVSCKKINENKNFLTDSKDLIHSKINKLGIIDKCSRVITPLNPEIANRALSLQKELEVLDGNLSEPVKRKLQRLNVEYFWALNNMSYRFGFEMYLLDLFRRLVLASISAMLAYALLELIYVKIISAED